MPKKPLATESSWRSRRNKKPQAPRPWLVDERLYRNCVNLFRPTDSGQTWNELPQPQLFTTFGFSNLKPR